MAQWWRICLPMQEMQILSLSWEDLLEEEIAIHSSIPTWEIPWTEGPGRVQFMGSQRVGHNLETTQDLSNHRWAICKPSSRGLVIYPELGKEARLCDLLFPIVQITWDNILKLLEVSQTETVLLKVKKQKTEGTQTTVWNQSCLYSWDVSSLYGCTKSNLTILALVDSLNLVCPQEKLVIFVFQYKGLGKNVTC